MISDRELWQYLQNPVPIPTPAEMFAFMADKLEEKGIALPGDADPFRRGYIPQGLSLFIPPRRDLTLNKLVRILGGPQACCHMDDDFHEDEARVPEGPYLLTEVQDGSRFIDVSPFASEAQIRGEDRSPLTTYEGIILAVLFGEFLNGFNLNLCGSRYEKGSVPCLALSSEIHLYANGIDFHNFQWGTPSCGRRMGTEEFANRTAARAAA